MRTYNGLTHLLRHTDADLTAGQSHVARLLGLHAAPPGAMWELSLYAGGVGISDKLALAVPAAAVDLAALARHLRLRSVAAFDDPDELAWLVGKDEDQPIDEAVAAFLTAERREFQPTPGPEVWFAAESDVNHWEAVWVADGLVAFLLFDQG